MLGSMDTPIDVVGVLALTALVPLTPDPGATFVKFGPLVISSAFFRDFRSNVFLPNGGHRHRLHKTVYANSPR